MRVCIIPARGGSKRIPRKNIKDFLGRPIISYPIETAIRSGLFDEVIVSTDDEEIANVAMEHGAKIPFLRPKELADDFTGTVPVIAHAIKELEKNYDEVEIACCVYPTSVFLSVEALLNGFLALNSSPLNEYSFSAVSFEAPIFRSFRILDGGGVEMFFPENFSKRSQDLPEAYRDGAQFYFGRRDAFCSQLPIFGENSIAVKLDRKLAVDIDTPEDWETAELIYKALQLC